MSTPAPAAARERPIIPFLIWKDNVVTTAMRAGVPVTESRAFLGEQVADGSARGLLWWRSHETIDGAVESIIFVHKQRNREVVDSSMAFLRSALLGDRS